MKQFLWLRIIATFNGTLLLTYAICILWVWSTYNRYKLWLFILNEAMMFILLSHCFCVFYFFKKYPDTDISKTEKIYHRVIALTCWLCIIFFMLGITGSLISPNRYETSKQQLITNIVIAALSTICVLFIAQLLGLRTLIGAIQRNARQKLEESFT